MPRQNELAKGPNAYLPEQEVLRIEGRLFETAPPAIYFAKRRLQMEGPEAHVYVSQLVRNAMRAAPKA